jgi:hypothetical protein
VNFGGVRGWQGKNSAMTKDGAGRAPAGGGTGHGVKGDGGKQLAPMHSKG